MFLTKNITAMEAIRSKSIGNHIITAIRLLLLWGFNYPILALLMVYIAPYPLSPIF